MIAGAIATLIDDAQQLQSALDVLAARPEIELGQFTGEARRIPLTIDSLDRRDVESVTKWLQDRPEVAFVDIVFVHLEDDKSCTLQGNVSANAPHELQE